MVRWINLDQGGMLTYLYSRDNYFFDMYVTSEIYREQINAILLYQQDPEDTDDDEA